MAKAILPAKITASTSKKKSSGSVGKGFAIGFAICLIGVVLLCTGIYFNVANLKTNFITVFKIEQTQEDLLAKKQLELDTTNKFLEDSLKKLTEDQNKLKTDMAEAEKQKSENEKTKELLSAEKMKTEQLVAIYAEMAPQKAADILSIDEKNQQAVIVLKNMDQKAVAQILSLMTPAKASQILALIAN